MCTYSMIVDHYRDKWEPFTVPGSWPNTAPNTSPGIPPFRPAQPPITDAEIAEFRKLLERAREYDKRNGEPECELEEKKEALRQIAKKLGVELGQF